jgi:hypothetical protein
LLSATPGDTWSDYIPVFIANGFYKNRRDFIVQHVVYKPFRNYPVIDHYVNIPKLEKLRNYILVPMDFERHVQKHEITEFADYDKDLYKQVVKSSWNPFKDEPIDDAAGLSQCLRRIVNSDKTRLEKVLSIVEEKRKLSFSTTLIMSWSC